MAIRESIVRDMRVELYYLRKVFFRYKSGVKYLYNKYLLSRRLWEDKNILEKPVNVNNFSIHILIGYRQLTLVLWSLASFYRVIDTIGELFIHNDGSLKKKETEILRRKFPSAMIIEPTFILENSNGLDNYPSIKKFRAEISDCFLFKKLIDPFFVSDKECHLIIDSDLLWFKKPNVIENEIKNGCKRSLMMENHTPNYVTFKDKSRLAENLALYNSGIVLYNRQNFNLEKLANYLERVGLDNVKNNFFIEQAGFASCLENLEKLPRRYFSIENGVDEETIARHYTIPRRPLFFIEGVEALNIDFA